ncbi:MAG: hypothetical protein ACJ8IK_09575 [Burkholderiaceae bacterium]|jgi:hypothetical protein
MKHLTLLRAIALVALAASSGAQARNVGLKIPTDGLVAAARAAGGVGDIEFAFGSASARGADVVGGTTTVLGVASPFAEPHGFRPTQAEACANAVRDALGRLAAAARAAGGHAVVGIVSTYNGDTVDDPTQVECRMGTAKVLAPLSGVIAKGLPPKAP